MINTYNESKLHKQLKTLYAENFFGETEVELDGRIYDIVCEDGTIIEIQTKNLTKLLSKILNTLDTGRKVILVHPVVIRKWILTKDKNGNTLSNRKSPKVNSIYDMFDELTGVFPALLHKNFRLDIIEINMTEIREKTEIPVQSPNSRRRFKKDWIKTGKELKEIISIKTFSSAYDYLKLLPTSLPSEFCAKDLYTELKKDKTLPASAAKKAHLILWVFVRMNLIEECCVKNRNRYYKINPSFL